MLEIGDGGSVNAPPVAADDTATTLANTAVDINVAANDHDPDGNLAPTSATTTCTGCTTPANGALVNNGDGTFRYTPNTNFTGTNSFTYQICDTLASCDTATVTITTTPPGGTQTEVFVGAGGHRGLQPLLRRRDGAAAGQHPWQGLHHRRQRLPERLERQLHQLLRADVGSSEGSHPSDSRRQRLRHAGGRALLQLLRRGGG